MKPLTFNQLERAYIKIHENASELIEEARILLDNEKYARAYFLAQIASEEIGKLPIIFQEATKSYYKEKHDWKRFNKRLRSHIDKNRMTETISQFPQHDGDEIRKKADKLNLFKNSSLYADLENNRYTKPSEKISKNTAIIRIEETEKHFTFVSRANHHIKGTMKQYLESDKAKKARELFREMGLID